MLLHYIIKRYPRIKKLARKFKATMSFSVRLGKVFWEWYAFFRESEAWDIIQIRQFQLEQIQLLLTTLKNTSRFYRLRLCNFNISAMNSLNDLKLIPMISRSEYKLAYKNILADHWQAASFMKVTTSGTTGLALQFYHEVRDQEREWAAICHQWERVGFEPDKSRRAEFRGLTVSDRLVDIFPEYNMVRCSILNLRKEHILYYAEKIKQYNLEFYHGYPSAIYLLAKEILHEGIAFPQPKAILLASEMVFDWQVSKIQEAFPRAKLFAHYGCAERTVLAGWCEHKRQYHVLPQYAYIEIDPVTSEIIGTNLYNTINGFVRYRMTDTASDVDYDECTSCHRPYTPILRSLGGRFEDYLYSPEKGWIPPAIVTYPLKSLKAIREVQLEQREKEKILIRYSTFYNDEVHLDRELNQIKSGLHELFGTRMDFKFTRVDDFPRGATGKYKWIINKIDKPLFD